MKNSILWMIFLMLICTGCNDDDNSEITSGNHFEISNRVYTVTTALVEDYGPITSDSLLYNIDLSVFGGFVYDVTEGAIRGTGHLVFFEIASDTSGFLRPGTYTQDIDFDTPFTFRNCSAAENFNFITTSGTVTPLQDMTMDVTKNGDIYSISFEGRSIFLDEVKGIYEGELIYEF